MSYVEQKNLSNELKSVFEDFKEKHAEMKNEIKRIGEESGETRTTLNRIHDRMDEVETKLNRPMVHEQNKQEQSDYTKAFNHWFRTGDEKEIKQITFPNLNETIDPEGGYLVPPEYYDQIIGALSQWSPIRRYARVVSTNSKQLKIPVQQQVQNLHTGEPASGMFRAGWTADLGPVNQTDTGQFNMKTIPTCDLYGMPAATMDMLEDNAYDIESFMREELAKSFAFVEGNAFAVGDGVGKPTGILHDTTSYSQVTANTGSQYSIGDSPDLLIHAFYSLPDYYARNGTWLLNRQTIRTIREWVDGNGQYLWTPVYGQSIANEAPATILNCPYAECIDFPAPDSSGIYDEGAVPIIFGDIRAAYTIADRRGISVLRDPYTHKPFILYFTTARVGGLVVLPEALVAINVNPN